MVSYLDSALPLIRLEDAQNLSLLGRVIDPIGGWTSKAARMRHVPASSPGLNAEKDSEISGSNE